MPAKVCLSNPLGIKEILTVLHRLSSDSARPKTPLLRWYATATAITREAVYFTAPLIPSLHKRYPRLAALPPLGKILLIAVNLALLLSLAFYGFDVLDRRNWEAIAVRCGWITITQLPLIFLLAGKRNLIGYVTGTSYERLNWIHRWVSRSMFLTATMHLGHFLRTWARYDYVERKFKIDLISRRGLGAWCVLLWIVLSSFAPIRGWRYEFFVIQHIISVLGFTVVVMLHAPTKAQHFVWLPVGIYFLDRLLRFVYVMWNNLGLFSGEPRHILACKATFHPLPAYATKVSIKNPPFNWSPGQHALLTLPSLTGLQSHPFSITSLPSDKTLEFIIRAQEGATQKLLSHATGSLPPASDVTKTAIIDGPYGRVREMEQFDTVVLLAGGAGACFTMPLLRDLVRRKRERLATVTRRVRLVWVVRERGQIEWFAREIGEAVDSVAGMKDFVLEMSIYVTCDDSLTMDNAATQGAGEKDTQKPTSAQELEEPVSDVLPGKDGTTVKEAELRDDDDSACCCQDILEDEDTISYTSTTPGSCCCCGKPKPTTTSADALNNTPPVAPALLFPEEVKIVSGRPAVRALVGKQLEKACGETAVVVCGPSGLIDAARMAVVGLSDERAVHKGTGAQGVYLHCEAFCI